MDGLAINTQPMKQQIKNIFIEGPVTPAFIADAIAKHSHKTNIGAHSIFLGQVRNDVIDGREVQAIDYSAYTDMANERMHHIREEVFAAFPLTCMHTYHSLGPVRAGEISLFVFTSSAHRRAAIDACNLLVERIKNELPVWGKECFEEGYVWKKGNG